MQFMDHFNSKHVSSISMLCFDSICTLNQFDICTANRFDLQTEWFVFECAHAQMLKRFPACSSERLSRMEEAGSRSSPIPVRGDQDEVCPMCTTVKFVIFFVCCRCGLFYAVWDCQTLQQKWRESSMMIASSIRLSLSLEHAGKRFSICACAHSGSTK